MDLRRTCTAITKKTNEIQVNQNQHEIQSCNTPLKIGDKNVQIVKMKGDGHCGFRALVKALDRNIGKNKESKEITKLRKKTSELLKQNQKNIFGEITLEQLVNLEYFKPNVTICQNFDKYCEEIEKKGYIGAIEILLLSKELTFQIKDNTLIKLWGTYGIGEEIHSDNEKIMLLFNGSNHYDLLYDFFNYCILK